MKLMYSLDNESDSTIVINILPLLTAVDKQSGDKRYIIMPLISKSTQLVREALGDSPLL